MQANCNLWIFCRWLIKHRLYLLMCLPQEGGIF
jgi:hypothetical protein